MTPGDVRAAAELLGRFRGRFAPLFGEEQAQDHAYDYVKGLMVYPERMMSDALDFLVGRGDASGLLTVALDYATDALDYATVALDYSTDPLD